MKYKTEISNIKDGEESIRGYRMNELVRKKSFSDIIFLLLKGELPNENESKMFGSILSVSIDHGPGTASSQASRTCASAKSELHVSVAAGILAMGELHGSAVQGAAEFFVKNKGSKDIVALVQKLREEKIRVPGFGHAVLAYDERSDILFDIAKEFGVYGSNCEFAQKFHSELNKVSSKQLPINVDGSMAAVLLDLGFEPEIMKGIFVISRVPGLVAQVFEEQIQRNGLRRIPQEDIEYIGQINRVI